MADSGLNNPSSPADDAPSPERVALVTGTLAAPALKRVANELAEAGLIEPEIFTLKIQVAALMTTDWVSRKLDLGAPSRFSRIILPGYCRGDLAELEAQWQVPVQRGPVDLNDLPELFGSKSRRAPVSLDAYDIDIIAEINHATRLPLDQILSMAEAYRADGANVIDIGCDPQADRPAWAGVADVVRELRARGFRVSVDSFQPDEVAAACEAGAELVLSVNSTNCALAKHWGAEVVAIPDTPSDLDSLDSTVEQLVKDGVRFRLDPIIEPIGFGFATSLGRYLDCRKRYPDAEIMMGIGNLSEMTAVDSAGVNTLLIGFCQEQAIRSVLTTQVINWARSSVREIDHARRLMHYAVAHGTVPKHIDNSLVMLRDARLRQHTQQTLAELAAGLTDRNIRLFTEGPRIHAMNKHVHAQGEDPFPLFDQLGVHDPSHAFYLGYEMAKAVTAITLGKQYVQDEPLNWGMLTREETSHYERRKRHARDDPKEPNEQ